MQIKDSSVSFSQQHRLERSEQQRVIGQAIVLNASQGPPRTADAPAVIVDLSAFQSTTEQFLARLEVLASNQQSRYETDTDLLKALVEAMTGKKINTPGDADAQPSEGTNSPAPSTSNLNTTTPDDTSPPAGNREASIIIAQVENSFREYEYSNVSINAELTDDEGVAFSISMSVTMERSFESRQSLTVSQIQVQDPLVINFNGDTARLSNDLVEFDLDSDGINEQLPSLISNSAYIALDKNGDGIINNGSELFGANSGNGFMELAAYDEDGNGFIDSNDAIFSQLVAYRMEDGASQLLSEFDVGALFTSSVDSPFRITGTQNNTLGEIRSTGFYIDQQRQAGSLQQVDLVV